MKRVLILAVVFSFLLTSCASIFSGSKDDVVVKSDPQKATILVDGNKVGVTPKTLQLQRGKQHVIQIKMDGYESYKITTSNSITGWFWGNLLCGGLIGIVIDLVTGNAYDVDPDFISVTLERGTAMNEQTLPETFGGIIIEDDNGTKLGYLKIDWQ